MNSTSEDAPKGFTKAAESYDAAVRRNIQGSERLVMSLPDGEYARVLDVGCGTGFTSAAMLARFPVRELVGVDPAEGMLEVFATKREELAGVQIELRAEDVMAMDVPDDHFDAVLCAMALHWVPDKPGALARMARALRPGGVVGVLTAGRGGEEPWQQLLVDIGAPDAWTGWFATNQRDVDEIATDMRAADLEPLDIWMERRRRHTPPDAFMARTRSVAAHLLGNPPGDTASWTNASRRHCTSAPAPRASSTTTASCSRSRAGPSRGAHGPPGRPWAAGPPTKHRFAARTGPVICRRAP